MGFAQLLERLRREDPEAFQRLKVRMKPPPQKLQLKLSVDPTELMKAMVKMGEAAKKASVTIQEFAAGLRIPAAALARRAGWLVRRPQPPPRPTLREQRRWALARARRLGRAR